MGSPEPGVELMRPLSTFHELRNWGSDAPNSVMFNGKGQEFSLRRDEI
jgi:hypothetical protein